MLSRARAVVFSYSYLHYTQASQLKPQVSFVASLIFGNVGNLVANQVSLHLWILLVYSSAAASALHSTSRFCSGN